MKKKALLLPFLAIPLLSACTSKALYEVSNDLWCNYQDNTEMDPEKEIYPGEKRKPFPEKCTYLSYEDYQKQKDEVDKAVEEHKRKANM